MKFIQFFFTTIAVLLLSNCDAGNNSNSDQVVAYFYQQPSSSICDVSENFSDGFLCVIQPSRLDSNTRDIYGSNSVGDLSLGFGYHVVVFPTSGTAIKGVYIHLTGSFGRPYNQDNFNFSSKTFLKESWNSGYIMIQLAYHNRFAVNSLDECAGSNMSIDNCAGNVRLEKITGADVSSINATPITDSIEYRLKVLVQYLETKGFAFPVKLVKNDNIDWSSVRVGGHSQGAGHALYLAKYFNTRHACMLAGAYDVADTIPNIPAENIADWYLDNSVAVDITKLRGLLSVDDDNYNQFISAYNVLGLIENVGWQAVDAAPYSDESNVTITGHAAPLKDPRFATQRRAACFE